MANVSVNEYIDAAIAPGPQDRDRIKNEGNLIAQFLVVRQGLEGRIPSADLSTTAATLTAAIWARSGTN